MGENPSPGPDPRVSDEEILSVFSQSPDPVLTATEVAEKLPLTRRGIYDRLTALEEQGELESKKVGGRTTVWWFPGNTRTDIQS
jgi:predicted ArsR family transcriptional regulator